VTSFQSKNISDAPADSGCAPTTRSSEGRCAGASGGTRLLILACSRSKVLGAQAMPAIQRYSGPLWQTLKTADPFGERATVAALSARHGFIASSYQVDNYNVFMTEAHAREMIAGGIAQRWPRNSTRMSPELPGTCAKDEIEQLAERQFQEVAIVGGAHYLAVMRAFVWEFQAAGHIASHARIVEINDSIGLMRQQLRKWLIGDTSSKRVSPLVVGDVEAHMSAHGYLTVAERGSPDAQPVTLAPNQIRAFREWLNEVYA
jgi:hypothetical protein